MPRYMYIDGRKLPIPREKERGMFWWPPQDLYFEGQCMSVTTREEGKKKNVKVIVAVKCRGFCGRRHLRPSSGNCIVSYNR